MAITGAEPLQRIEHRCAHLLGAHLAAQQGVGDEGGEGGDDRDGEEREAIPGDVTLLLGTHSNDVSCQDCSRALWESRVSVLVVVGHLGAELGQLLLAVLTDTILHARESGHARGDSEYPRQAKLRARRCAVGDKARCADDVDDSAQERTVGGGARTSMGCSQQFILTMRIPRMASFVCITRSSVADSCVVRSLCRRFITCSRTTIGPERWRDGATQPRRGREKPPAQTRERESIVGGCVAYE